MAAMQQSSCMNTGRNKMKQYVNKIILKEYKEQIGLTGVYFDLEFKSGLTLVYGDSGVGKTLFVEKLRNLAAIREDICIMDYSTSKKMLDMVFINKGLKDTLIVIDNGDVLLSKKHREVIKHDFDNQYIIFTRDCTGMFRGPSSVANMVRKGNIITLEYIQL